jgi:hypothetical protein
MTRKSKELSREKPLQLMKVEELGIQDTVRGLKEAGLSYLNIANEVNAKKLCGTGQTVSPMSVMRWCHKYMPDDYSDQDTNAINIYRHAVSLLNALSSQLDLLDTYIDNFSKEANKLGVGSNVLEDMKQINALMSTYEKMSNRKIALLGTIGQYQEKVYSFMSASEIVNTVLNAVKDKDVTMYAELTQQIKSDPMLAECYRKIKE